jgi:hypothetical protein
VIFDHNSAGPSLSVGLYDPDPSNFSVDVDGDVSAVTLRGNSSVLGDGLTSGANAIIPRVTVEPSTTAGVEYTLVLESVPAGGLGYRKYVSSDGRLVETINASWDNSTNLWTKDSNGTPSTRREFGASGHSLSRREPDAAWADADWETPIISFSTDGPFLARPTNSEWMWTPFMAQLTRGDTGFSADDGPGEVFGDIDDPGPGVTTDITFNSDRRQYELTTSTAGGVTAARVITRRRFDLDNAVSADSFLRLVQRIQWVDRAEDMYMAWGILPTSVDFTTTTTGGAFFYWDSSIDTFYACTCDQVGATRLLQPLTLPSDGVEHEFEIRYYGENLTGASTSFQYYINGVLVHTENVADTDGTPYLGGFAIRSEGNPSGLVEGLLCSFQGWYRSW